MEKMTFYVNKKMYYVHVKRTNNKNMYLRIKNGEIVLSAPIRIKDSEIDMFVSANIEKFAKYLEDIKKNALYSLEKSFIYIGGKKYNIVSLTGFKKSSILLKGTTAYINTLDGDDESMEKAIKKYLKESLVKYIKRTLPIYERLMKLPPHTFRVVFKTTTWGTNKLNEHKLSFSSKLSHYREEIIDYVIVHELAHTYEGNHQDAFWKIVEMYCPNWKKLRNELRADESLSE